MKDIYSVLELALPIMSGLLAWYLWSLRQNFVTKRSFSEFEETIGQDFQRKINKLEDKFEHLSEKSNLQHNSVTELQTTLKHVLGTLEEIKDYLFNRPRKKINKN